MISLICAHQHSFPSHSNDIMLLLTTQCIGSYIPSNGSTIESTTKLCTYHIQIVAMFVATVANTKKIFSVTIYRILLSDETTVSLLPTLKCHLYKHQVGGSISMAPLVFGIDKTLCTRPCSETNLKIVAKTYYVMSHVNAHRNYP